MDHHIRILHAHGSWHSQWVQTLFVCSHGAAGNYFLTGRERETGDDIHRVEVAKFCLLSVQNDARSGSGAPPFCHSLHFDTHDAIFVVVDAAALAAAASDASPPGASPVDHF